jgi:hypothetical protein
MSTQRGMCSVHLNDKLDHSAVESDIDLRRVMALSPQVCAYLALARESFSIVHQVFLIPSTSPRGAGRATSRLLHSILTYTVIIQFILSGMSGVTSHLASQAHTVARNTRSITLAVCALPVPFKNLFCDNEVQYPINPNVDHSPAWHPFLINEDIHGPAVDFAIRKAANTTSFVLAFVRASDLSSRHELSDKLKEFLQHAWVSEISSGAHLSLVKTVIHE